LEWTTAFVRSGSALVQNHGMPEGRLIAVVALVALLVASIWTHVLTLPDWEHPSGRDYDQAAVLIFAGIVVAAVYGAWFAWRLRRDARSGSGMND
jgi:hypothetical protein